MDIQPTTPALSVAPAPTVSSYPKAAHTAPPPPETSTASTASISPFGELLHRLQHLKQTDPAGFRKTVEQLAAQAATAAAHADQQERPDLAKLAEQLHKVAATGELASLKPANHPLHHRHPALKQGPGGTGTLLASMLQQLDITLGPNATPTSP